MLTSESEISGGWAASGTRYLIEYVLRARPPGEEDRSYGDLPVSFSVNPGYWHRTDAQSPWIVGTADAYWQRLIVHYGLNLYCAGCRQIALASTRDEEAAAEARRHTGLLLDDRTGEARPLRAWSDGTGGWRYGDAGTSLAPEGGSAFFFGTICGRYYLVDPLTGASHLPAALGGERLAWNFYDPFLGENSWAALIAPLQAAYVEAGSEALPPDGDAVRLARSLVSACLAMQSPAGGVYARPAAAGGMQEQLISNETNLTLYAGLTMLEQVLAGVPELAEERTRIDRLRQGLLQYFRNHLCGLVDGELRFHTCGTFAGGAFRAGVASDGQSARFAVDVHTWGMSILGVDEIDSRHGHGTCARLWETVKAHAGYYPSGRSSPLRGIGFSSGHQGEPVHDVCSPEWTFGAINMCRILAAEYEAPGNHRDVGLAARLREDEQSMLEGVSAFETDAPTSFRSRAYLYANRITDTGFGWHALPIPCLCATAWAVMVQNRFNPFRLGGDVVSTSNGTPAVPFSSMGTS